VIDDFNVDSANGIPYKSTIVPRMILGSPTGRTIVFTTGFDSSFVELVNKLVVCTLRQQPCDKLSVATIATYRAQRRLYVRFA
jgi:hypothetical protein